MNRTHSAGKLTSSYDNNIKRSEGSPEDYSVLTRRSVVSVLWLSRTAASFYLIWLEARIVTSSLLSSVTGRVKNHTNQLLLIKLSRVPWFHNNVDCSCNVDSTTVGVGRAPLSHGAKHWVMSADTGAILVILGLGVTHLVKFRLKNDELWLFFLQIVIVTVDASILPPNHTAYLCIWWDITWTSIGLGWNTGY